jgi:hypothetical protein
VGNFGAVCAPQIVAVAITRQAVRVFIRLSRCKNL